MTDPDPRCPKITDTCGTSHARPYGGAIVTFDPFPLDSAHHAQLTADQLRCLVGDKAQTVAAIVSHYEPTESVREAAPYRLTVNGLLQPGG
ncbi:hypothetical protein [Streptomyces sp. NPDC003943]